MMTTALKNVLANKGRLVSTILSIVIGVAFVSGTFVFSDTISSQFDTLFSDIYAGVDATVRSADESGGPFDESVLEVVAGVDGVEVAAGAVGGYAQLIGKDGELVGGQGPPTLGFSWITEPRLNALSIAEGNGRGPAGPLEVAIDAGTATLTGYVLGDTVEVATQSGTGEYLLVGIANFGDQNTLLGATLTAFHVDQAQTLFGLKGQFTSIDVVAAPGIDSETINERIGESLPPELEAVTGAAQSQEQLDDISSGFGFLTSALLAFAAVAVFVGSFIIYNTFRIIVGQRTRELALFRALGAESRQISRMVTTEAFIIGLVASAIGVAAGLGLAVGLRSAMNAVGSSIPAGSLVLEPRTVVVGLVVGVAVTLMSAIIPARKAAATPPIAAMRSEATEKPEAAPLRKRAVIGGVMTALGAAAIGIALATEVPSGLTLVAGGAITVFLGVTVLAPLFAKPIACLLGSPLRGVVGQLAKENVRRSPRRTASTASALMIGVALVVFVSIFASSIKSSVEGAFSDAFPSDLILSSSNPGAGIPMAAFDELSLVEEIKTSSSIMLGSLEIDGESLNMAAIEPSTVGEVYSLEPSIKIETLTAGLLVHTETLAERNWSVGDRVDVTFGSTPTSIEVVGTFEDLNFGKYVISQETFTKYQNRDSADVGLVALAEGVSPDQGRTAVADALGSFPVVEISTASEAIVQAEAQVDQLVALFYGLLGLAILIAMIGIANTLTLSVAERTREIGLLRAVGLSRAKTSAMVRWEAAMIGIFGAILGVVVGTGLGSAVVTSLSDDGLSTLSLPWNQLSAWIVLGGVAAVLASFGPARKAARLDVLKAIAHQ